MKLQVENFNADIKRFPHDDMSDKNTLPAFELNLQILQ